MDEQSGRSLLTGWLKEIVPYSNLEEYVRWRDSETGRLQRVIFCTDSHTYTVSAFFPMEDGQSGYLGCVSSCRSSPADRDSL